MADPLEMDERSMSDLTGRVVRVKVRSTGYVIECTIECWPGEEAPVTFRIMESGETVILKPDEYEIVEFMDEDPDRKSWDKPSP